MNKYLLVFMAVLIIGCKEEQEHIIKKKERIVVAHRGASGYLPEHTIAAKAMAYAMKPDFLEQDLVLTKDGIPMVIHDIYLDDITDVFTVYPSRKRADGRYYVIDFTYDELELLSVHERVNLKNNEPEFKSRFPVKSSVFRLHSLEEELLLIQGLNKSTGQNMGIYPEIKNPSFHLKEGQDISKIVLEVLSNYGYSTQKDKCMLQCFDPVALKRIRRELGCQLHLTQLVEELLTEDQIKEIASYANAIGPWYKQLLLEKNADGTWQIDSLVERAHAHNLQVIAYTFRADDLSEGQSFEDLLGLAFDTLNFDGIFTDFPDKVVEYLEE
ncbi:MAG: glycerophosphodiester phosphodiesterase [Flavobacteriaceae bacterium]|nr:MAG: glycerophosphodiester phosphodiesterase [Flavobacteriaceae bacterium]